MKPPACLFCSRDQHGGGKRSEVCSGQGFRPWGQCSPSGTAGMVSRAMSKSKVATTSLTTGVTSYKNTIRCSSGM